MLCQHSPQFRQRVLSLVTENRSVRQLAQMRRDQVVLVCQAVAPRASREHTYPMPTENT